MIVLTWVYSSQRSKTIQEKEKILWTFSVTSYIHAFLWLAIVFHHTLAPEQKVPVVKLYKKIHWFSKAVFCNVTWCSLKYDPLVKSIPGHHIFFICLMAEVILKKNMWDFLRLWFSIGYVQIVKLKLHWISLVPTVNTVIAFIPNLSQH